MIQPFDRYTHYMEQSDAETELFSSNNFESEVVP